MDFYEQPYDDSPLDQLNRSAGDWTKFILDRPMTGAPGNEWAYNSGAAILSGAVIREISGTNVDAFARTELFEPIGVRGETWFKSPFDGLPHCGGGLNLRTVDLARVGYLVLRGGAWGSRQIIPPAWLAASIAPDSRGGPVFFSNYGSAYGNFWALSHASWRYRHWSDRRVWLGRTVAVRGAELGSGGCGRGEQWGRFGLIL